MFSLNKPIKTGYESSWLQYDRGSSPAEFKVKLSVLVIAMATTQVCALSGFWLSVNIRCFIMIEF